MRRETPRARAGDAGRHNKKHGDNPTFSQGYAQQSLRSVIADPDAPATARAAAARTLAEIEGLIGRHSQAPVDRAVSLPIAVLSRPELERELARLRAACAADTVSPVA